MDSAADLKWNAKHAWSEVERTGPPKRPAEQRVAGLPRNL